MPASNHSKHVVTLLMQHMNNSASKPENRWNAQNETKNMNMVAHLCMNSFAGFHLFKFPSSEGWRIFFSLHADITTGMKGSKQCIFSSKMTFSRIFSTRDPAVGWNTENIIIHLTNDFYFTLKMTFFALE